VAPLKASLPDSISKSIAAIENRSARASSASPRTCSGAM